MSNHDEAYDIEDDQNDLPLVKRTIRTQAPHKSNRI